MKCKIKVLCYLAGVFPRYQPIVGQIYEADYVGAEKKQYSNFCVIDIKNKRIVLRKDEFEVVGGADGGN